MEIQTVVVGGLQMPSLVVLKTRDDATRQITLPIRIGPVEAAAITAGIEGTSHGRPLTHDLLSNVISTLDSRLISISIVDVQGTTFFATLQLMRPDGSRTDVDCRPSDAIALAVRTGVPIYAREQVLDTATMPDFSQAKKDVEEQELQAFHDFVEGLSPEDFG
jgi:bifunctional DNase/RNase